MIHLPPGHRGGYFTFTVRDKRTGVVKSIESFKNGITEYAKELMLTNALTGTWYVGLIRSFDVNDPNLRVPPFPAIVLNTLGWQEYDAYTGGRKPWTPTIETSPVKATSAPVQFVGFNEAMTFGMAGAFLARTSAKGNGFDTIFAWSTGGSIITLDDVVDVDYEITI